MHLDRILPFLARIGIVVTERPLPAATLLPGILIEAGTLVIDREKLKYPGDLLHEAGHIAVVVPSQRASLSANLQTGPAEEMAAIAWSYAAALHIGLDPALVLHDDGYKGGGSQILENFQAGRYFAVPFLAWCGMTRERAGKPDEPVFPQMRTWLRPESVAA